MIIIKIKDIFYIITSSYMFRLPLSEPSSDSSLFYEEGNVCNWQYC
jgi:hypothetical protein